MVERSLSMREVWSSILQSSIWSHCSQFHFADQSIQLSEWARTAQAYQLLLAAAGMFQFVRETCGPLLSGKTASSDCSPEVIVHLLQLTSMPSHASRAAP